jgi:hypothetical protein
LIDVSFGASAFWQRQKTPSTVLGTALIPSATTYTSSEIAYLSLTARMPTLHF